MNQPRRILFVAAEFPPYKTIGRLRTLKFCLHLQQLGWDCFVLTMSDEPSATYDPKTLQEIPSSVKVFRARPWQPEARVINGIKKILKRPVSNRPAVYPIAATANLAHTHNGHEGFAQKLVASKKVFDKFIYRHLLIPDDFCGWLMPALRLGRKLCREQQIDLVFTTAPPFTSLLLGRFLKSATGIPWVADYRDLWTGDVLREWVPAWRCQAEIALEKWALATADAIIAVSEPKAEVLQHRLKKVAADKFFTITNGYDPEEYQGYSYHPNGTEKIRVVYTGRLFKNRRGYELLEAAGELFQERADLKTKLQVEYYGGIAPEIKTRLDMLLRQYDLAAQFKFFPEVPYEEAKALQANADVLLLIVDTGETTSGVIPGKLFEYVAASRPILCIAAPGATPEIITKGRLGWVTPPGDVQKVKELLARLLQQKNFLNLDPDQNYISQFERSKLANRLNNILNKVLLA